MTPKKISLDVFDVEIFPGKTMSDLFSETYTSISSVEDTVHGLLDVIKNKIKSSGDVMATQEAISSLLDTLSKKPDQLTRLLQVAQRVVNTKIIGKAEDDIDVIQVNSLSQADKEILFAIAHDLVKLEPESNGIPTRPQKTTTIDDQLKLLPGV